MSFLSGWFNIPESFQHHIESYKKDTDALDQFASTLTSGIHTSASNPVSSFFFEDEKNIVAVKGNAYWSNNQPESEAPRTEQNTAYLINRAYQSQGASFIHHLAGHFCIFIIDKQKQELLLFSDRLATYPIAFTTVKQSLFFATNVKTLKKLANSTFSIDPQQIYNYLYFHVVPSPQCIYENIQYIPPGSYLHISNGQKKITRYWQPEYQETPNTSEAQFKEEFFATLTSSMKASSSNLGKVGCFLSGGTDSSTVSGKLTELQNEPVHTFSIGFNADGYDEMEFARTASKHFGAIHHEYYVTPEDVINAIPKIASAYDSPFGNSSAVPTYYCALLAKNEGIDTLLGGDGGDELFGGNERYLKQQIFARYQHIPKPLRSLFIEPLVKGSASALSNVSLLAKAQSYIDQANMQMPDRLQTYNLLNKIGIDAIFEPEFLATVNSNIPESDIRQAFIQSEDVSFLNKMLALDLKYTLSDNDLPKVTRMGELAGINVSFPLLENQIIDFANRLPSNLKIKDGKLRYFFKDSLKDFLPQEIITKSKHGFGLPFGPWLKDNTHLKQITLDSLHDLKKRNIVKQSFIDNLTNNYINEHAGYYGTMIWILMMLEQWYKHNEA